MNKKPLSLKSFVNKLFSKKVILLVIAMVLFVAYFIVTDPDANVIQNLPFGSQLVMLFSIFFIAALAIAFIETYTDIFTDEIAKDESRVATKANESPEGAGSVLIAKSLRILSYAIILAALVISVRGIV